MKTYFGYVRVSTTRQGDGVSPIEQKRLINEYAEQHHLSISDWFVEQRTAAKQGRVQFDRMLAALADGRAAGVVIHKIDRGSRNLSDWARLNQLFDRGVDVRFVHEGLDFNSRAGRLTGDILAVVAADFIRNNRDETLKGFYGRLNQGLYPLPAPLGYRNCGKGKPKEHDPVTAPLVRQLFELYGTGRYSLWTLRAETKRLGLRSKGGKVLTTNTLSRLLHNPFYIGVIRIERRNETFQGAHKPLITKRLFDQVQLILSGRAPTKIRVHDFAYRQFIKCAACGRSLAGEKQKGYIYYRCHGRECGGTSLRETHIDQQVFEALQRIGFTEEEFRDLRDVGDREKAHADEIEAVRLANLQRALTLCDDRLNRLTDALLDQAIDKDMFNVRKATILEERRDLLDGLKQADRRYNPDQLMEKFELAKTAQLRPEILLPMERRMVLKSLASNLVAEGKELGITLRFPFDRVAEARFSQYGAPCCRTSRTGSAFLRVAHMLSLTPTPLHGRALATLLHDLTASSLKDNGKAIS